MTEKIYSSRKNKTCCWHKCKRAVHAHVDEEPFCSTHYPSARREWEARQKDSKILSQRLLIHEMEDGIRKGKRIDIKLALEKLGKLDEAELGIKKFLSAKRKIWAAVIEGNTAYLKGS